MSTSAATAPNNDTVKKDSIMIHMALIGAYLLFIKIAASRKINPKIEKRQCRGAGSG
jgi:hypothetical protein